MKKAGAIIRPRLTVYLNARTSMAQDREAALLAAIHAVTMSDVVCHLNGFILFSVIQRKHSLDRCDRHAARLFILIRLICPSE